MNDVRFTIIIPTCGRESLSRTLESILRTGYLPQDEVIVVGDGYQAKAKQTVDSYASRMANLVYMDGPLNHCFGHPQRNFVMKFAKGTHLLFIDDDDEYINDALSAIRLRAGENPEKIIIFRMNLKGSTDLIWRKKEVMEANVSTQLFVVPNIPGRLGTWGNRYAGDFDFIRSTVDRWPGRDASVVWDERVIVRVY